ncbi:MAG: DUF72 domain-containing protein [bacterium]|nr:DUF72 domain-containing protein [bacterium]
MVPLDISVGTSGWKFDDWAGTFYPLRVPKNKWLEYYAARFPIGEINSTYYRIAPPSVYDAIARKTPSEFRLFVKVHGDVTHSRSDPLGSLRCLLQAIQPLRESGKLLGLLAQFPREFRFSASNLSYLLMLAERCSGACLCVEFRHGSWVCEEAIAPLRENGIAWVTPDEPALPDLVPFRLITTADIAYIRLHGRNATAWRDPSAGDRYDYDYSEQELTTIGEAILRSEVSVKAGYILFNNCHLGQAPRNAWWMQTWLNGHDAGR